MIIDLLISETKIHLKSIGYEYKNIDKNFIISGPSSILESIIAVTLITELEEKIQEKFDIKFDFFELITEMSNKDITLDFIAIKIQSINKLSD